MGLMSNSAVSKMPSGYGNRSGKGKRKSMGKYGGGGTGNAVDSALRWLAEHQEADGSWDCDKYGGDKANADPAVTAWALLAFMGAGHSTEFGKYRDNVRRAVDWLITQQAATGCIGPLSYQGVLLSG